MNKKFLLSVFLVLMFSVNTFAFMGFPVRQPLRDARELIYQFDTLTKIITFLLAIFIAGVALLTYLKFKKKRFLLIGLAFILMAAQWSIKILDLFIFNGYYFTDPLESMFVFGAFVLIGLALFWKKE